MTKSTDIPWKRVAAEATAIVGSILLAFWIDAWWEENQDRREEHVMLVAILDEFRDKKDVLQYATRINRSILESTRTLQRLASMPDQKPDPDLVDRLLADLSWVEDESDWTSATLDGFIASGGISLVADQT